MVQHQYDFRKILCKKVVGRWRKILQGPPSRPVHQVAWEWESWHQWRKLQCVEKSLHYLQIRKSILVIADTKDIAHACITCTTSPKCKVILQQHWQIEQIQTETVVPWLPDAITCYHKVQLLCVWLWITVVGCFLGINSDDYWFPSITRGVQFRVSALLLKDSSYRHFVSLGLAKMPWRRVSWLNESSQITPHKTQRPPRVDEIFLKISSAHTLYTYGTGTVYIPIFFFRYRSEVSQWLLGGSGWWLTVPTKLLVWTLAPRVSVAWHGGCGPKRGRSWKKSLLRNEITNLSNKLIVNDYHYWVHVERELNYWLVDTKFQYVMVRFGRSAAAVNHDTGISFRNKPLFKTGKVSFLFIMIIIVYQSSKFIVSITWVYSIHK